MLAPVAANGGEPSATPTHITKNSIFSFISLHKPSPIGPLTSLMITLFTRTVLAPDAHCLVPITILNTLCQSARVLTIMAYLRD